MTLLEVEGVDGSKAFINPANVAAIMPAAEKGVPVIGTCIIFLTAPMPPVVVKESPSNMAARVALGMAPPSLLV